MAIAVGLSFVLAGWKGLAVAIGAMLLDKFGSEASKAIFARPRPSPSLVAVSGTPSGFTFPSRHHHLLQRHVRLAGRAGVARPPGSVAAGPRRALGHHDRARLRRARGARRALAERRPARRPSSASPGCGPPPGPSTPDSPRFRGFLAAAFVLAWALPAGAHPAPFSYLDLHLDAAGVTGSLVVHDLDAAHDLNVTVADSLLEPEVAARYGTRWSPCFRRDSRWSFDGQAVTPAWTAFDVRARSAEPPPVVHRRQPAARPTWRSTPTSSRTTRITRPSSTSTRTARSGTRPSSTRDHRALDLLRRHRAGPLGGRARRSCLGRCSTS